MQALETSFACIPPHRTEYSPRHGSKTYKYACAKWEKVERDAKVVFGGHVDGSGWEFGGSDDAKGPATGAQVAAVQNPRTPNRALTNFGCRRPQNRNGTPKRL